MMIGFITCTFIGIWFIYAVGSTVVIRKRSKRIIRTLPKSEGVLLTFDDGPHPDYTIRLLQLLKKHHIQVIFFVVGELVERHPNIIKQMHQAGHVIGIHHYTHTSNWWLLPHHTKKQVIQTKQSIEKIIGQKIVLYRPPWGHFNMFTLSTIDHLQPVMWSHIYKDWKCSNHRLQQLLEQPPPKGSIILLHDNGDTKGANESAPLEMLRYLEMYIEKQREDHQPFADPHNLLKRKEGSQ